MIGKLLGHTSGADDRALRTPCAELGEGRCCDNCRQPRHRYGHTAGRFSRPVIYTTPVRFGADSRIRPPAGGSRVGGGGCPRWRNGDYRKQRVRRSACAGIGGGGAARYWAVVRQLTGWFAGMAAHGRVLAEPARLRRRGTGDCGEGTEFIERGHAPLPAPGDSCGEGRNEQVGQALPTGSLWSLQLAAQRSKHRAPTSAIRRTNCPHPQPHLWYLPAGLSHWD